MVSTLRLFSNRPLPHQHDSRMLSTMNLHSEISSFKFSALLLASILFLAGCAQTQSPSAATTQPFPPATPRAVVRVSRQIFPAVVRLDVAQVIYADGKRTLRRGIGSGVIIDPQGHILTNYHVAGRAAEIYVTLANKERIAAKLVGDDHWTDLAVVQMDMQAIRQRNISFNYAEMGESKTLVTGQDVMAIGTPFGLARTMTLGIVSNTERTFYPDKMSIDEYETGEFANWIQMDTPINPGNSGGPLVDLTGKIVGINTRGGGQNLNFAVPIDTARQVVRQILQTATAGEKGRVDRSDLGIDLKPLQDLETYYDIDINKGVLINSVDRGSPAEKAGVRTQDILLQINGQPINVRFPEEIAPARQRIADLPIGGTVTLLIKRGDQMLTLSAQTQKLEGAVGDERELQTWGLSVRDVTRPYANEHLLEDDKGVVVTTLTPGFPAAKAELAAGDVLRAINGQPVDNLDDLVRLYQQSLANREERILLTLQRGRGRRSALLRVTPPATPPTATTTQSASSPGS